MMSESTLNSISLCYTYSGSFNRNYKLYHMSQTYRFDEENFGRVLELTPVVKSYFPRRPSITNYAVSGLDHENHN